MVVYSAGKERIFVAICSAVYLSNFVAFVESTYVVWRQNYAVYSTLKQTCSEPLLTLCRINACWWKFTPCQTPWRWLAGYYVDVRSPFFRNTEKHLFYIIYTSFKSHQLSIFQHYRRFSRCIFVNAVTVENGAPVSFFRQVWSSRSYSVF
jgi:hypothetical protein